MATTLEHPTALAAPAAPSSPPPAAPRFARLRGVSWRHWFREVAVIAAGALAALAAQAWWQDRQDAGRERDYLRQLTVDTRENARRLDEAVMLDSLAGLHQKRAVEVLYGPGALPPADTILQYLVGYNGAFSRSDFEPVVGTYAALQTTGDLRLIEDERLRAALVAYAARLDGERENLRMFTQQAYGDMTRMVRALPFMRQYSTPDVLMAEARRFPYERLRHDADFDGLFFAVQAATTNRLRHLRDLRKDTHALLALLQTTRAGGAGPSARDTSTPRAR